MMKMFYEDNKDARLAWESFQGPLNLETSMLTTTTLIGRTSDYLFVQHLKNKII